MSQQPLRARFRDRGIAAVLDDERLLTRFAAIRAAFDVPQQFPDAVDAEAAVVAGAALEWPDRDESALPFLTIDPPGSMDLDQAMHIERAGEGFRVRYAIAYLPAFVAPGGAIDEEAHVRGQTIYAPDQRTPLHPPRVSEDAASLLPGQVRAAYVWDMHVGPDGEGRRVEVYRAVVRSVDRFDYEQVQWLLEQGTDDQRLLLLREVGLARVAFEQRRGGASLPMPEQEVTQDEDGHYQLGFRPPLEVEDWNAQISLMTGMAAGELMVGAQVGILRTLPAPSQEAVDRFRREAITLGVDWQQRQPYGEFLRSLDRTNPSHLALIYNATGLFRGSAYAAFDGQVPAEPRHGALASVYAHVTAPLRRLVDRYGLAVSEAISQGTSVPDWARAGLPRLPQIMLETTRTAQGVERACTDAVEAAVLEQYVDRSFEAAVVDNGEQGRWVIQVTDPAVVAQAATSVRVQNGDIVLARLIEADIDTGTVRFEITERRGSIG